MQDWVILRHPGLMLLFGAAVLACFLEKRWRATGGALFYLSGALAIVAATLLFLDGASLWESAAWLTALLLCVMEARHEL